MPEENSSNLDNQSIKKILIPVVKSEYNDKIISYAIILAKGSGASITAIHVLDKSAIGGVGDVFGRRVDEYENEMRKRSQELLTEVQQVIEKQGIKTSIEIIGNKSVAQGIIDYARESGVDVIVIGTKGLTGVGKFLMGSVASAVIDHAHCPVFAIR
ncbi:MAG: universal stress protein [Nitrososphaeraceae archaeon]